MSVDAKEKKNLIRKLQNRFDYMNVHYIFDNDTVNLSGLYPFFVNFMSLLGLKDALTCKVF